MIKHQFSTEMFSGLRNLVLKLLVIKNLRNANIFDIIKKLQLFCYRLLNFLHKKVQTITVISGNVVLRFLYDVAFLVQNYISKNYPNIKVQRGQKHVLLQGLLSKTNLIEPPRKLKMKWFICFIFLQGRVGRKFKHIMATFFQLGYRILIEIVAHGGDQLGCLRTP